jgi:MFS family permease
MHHRTQPSSPWSQLVWAQVLGLRVLQGLAMGVTTPAAYGLLADTFPAASISTANSMYASAVFFGGGLASLSALLLASFGWRGACVAVGSISLLAAALTFATVKDPKIDLSSRQVASKEATSSASASTKPPGESILATVLAIVRVPAVQFLFLASALRFCAGFGIGVWSAPFFREKFPDDQVPSCVWFVVI